MNDYLKYRDQMDSFDVLCCESKSWLTRFIGHTAVIYKNEAGQLMVLESTSLNKFSGIKGVQLTPLGLWLSHYKGKVYWRKWVWAGTGSAATEGRTRLECADEELKAVKNRIIAAGIFRRFIKIYRGTSYPSGRKGAWLLFKAWWDSPFLKKFSRNPVTTSVIFCSHLVGMLFHIVKFIKPILLASELVPDDFREEKYIDGQLEFGPNQIGHLAEEILIKG